MTEDRKYNSEEVVQLLKCGQVLQYTDRSDSAGVDYTRARAIYPYSYKYRRYIPSDIPLGGVIYYGPMYSQRGESSCFAWSIANNITALGLKVNSELLTELLNRSWVSNERSQRGFDQYTSDSSRILEKYGYKTDTVMFREFDPDSVSEEQLYCRYRATSVFIKELIGRQMPFIAGVNNHFYFRPISEKGHAVCVVGYNNISFLGMRVQVLDPNGINVWVPLELMAESIDSAFFLTPLDGSNKVDWYKKPITSPHKLLKPDEDLEWVDPEEKIR